MKVAISGANGFIGSAIRKALIGKGYIVEHLSRDMFDDDNRSELEGTISGCDVVINLAGAPINRRWNKGYKSDIYNSRIPTTRKIVDVINSIDNKPKLFISASAAGYYPSSGSYDDMRSINGNGFLSKLCADWESEAKRVDVSVRSVITRFGVVLSPYGGAFPQMIHPATFGVMFRIGDGSHSMSWVSLTDLVRAMEYIIDNDNVMGTLNLCAPHPITNYNFTFLAASKLQAKIILPIPKFVMRAIFGEYASVVTEGARIYPEKLLKYGFTFKNRTFEQFLETI